jgi:hypothetical protein
MLVTRDELERLVGISRRADAWSGLAASWFIHRTREYRHKSNFWQHTLLHFAYSEETAPVAQGERSRSWCIIETFGRAHCPAADPATASSCRLTNSLVLRLVNFFYVTQCCALLKRSKKVTLLRTHSFPFSSHFCSVVASLFCSCILCLPAENSRCFVFVCLSRSHIYPFEVAPARRHNYIPPCSPASFFSLLALIPSISRLPLGVLDHFVCGPTRPPSVLDPITKIPPDRRASRSLCPEIAPDRRVY